MILKIEEHRSNRDYLLIDNILRVHKGGTILYSGDDYFDHNNILIMDHTDKRDSNNQGAYILLRCRMKDNTIIAIAFDTVAYICNDNGKTIERVVVNKKRTDEEATIPLTGSVKVTPQGAGVYNHRHQIC